ncbi:hypothetical protein [uncultured Kordia sp.]|uniref:hypothetical protein n=1 Tax=uncultured Kordia sp. TaxID=507699 RepID=UPI00260F25E9|nr:hypothetical protein [uncultured Kordia sp.]
MKTIQKFALGIMLLAALQVSAQDTNTTEITEENAVIENFQLPTFSELSNDIAAEYSDIRERLPNLSNIGEHVKKGIRRGLFDQNSVAAAFQNVISEHSILPNITTKRFQLRNSLNQIMFNGFDATQLHLGGAYKNGQ